MFKESDKLNVTRQVKDDKNPKETAIPGHSKFSQIQQLLNF